jgi:D-lactate dehydrogenase (cytochrome)
MLRRVCHEFGGGEFVFAASDAARENLFRARKSALIASPSLCPGQNKQIWTTDVSVPLSRLADIIEATKDDLKSSFLHAPIVGHFGDGNFHLFILFDPSLPSEVAEANRINGRLVERAIAMKGTCTGEHGVGSGKRQYLVQVHDISASIYKRAYVAKERGSLLMESLCSSELLLMFVFDRSAGRRPWR